MEDQVEHSPSFDDGRPSFDHFFAKELLGKHVLAGVTALDASGRLITHKQFHGEILTADAREGLRIKLLGERAGEFEWLPRDTRAFSKARAGEYRLKSTGEVVVDPDYTTMWTYTEPLLTAP